MNKKSLLIGLVILAFIVSGCAAKSAGRDATTTNGIEPPVAAPAPAGQESFADTSKGTGVIGAAPDSQQMVMMTASLSIAVDDPSTSMEDIQKLAKQMGGFTVSSNLYKTQTASGSEVFAADVTIRVPAAQLDDAMSKIKAMTGDAKKYTLTENISGQDITKEYTDLQSRLRNLEEADAKLSEFYANATTTEDALAIYNQKMQVTEQIEVIKGQIKYYDESVSTSSISVQIVSKETIAPLTVAGWQPSGVAKDALQALLKFAKGFVNFLIWLGLYVLPIVLVIGLPIFFLVRWLVRRNRARKIAAQSQDAHSYPPIPTEKK